MTDKNETPMNGYNLTRNWFNYKFDNPGNMRAIHAEMYFYIIDLWNRLGQREKFGLPTDVTMQALEIGSYKTYKKTFEELVKYNFIIEISKSQNQYQSRIIALVKSAVSSAESSATIDEQLNKEQLNNYFIPEIKTLDLKSNDNPLHYTSDVEFVKDWNYARVMMLGVKSSNIQKLTFAESQDFKKLNRIYTIEQFKNGIRGLLNQKGIFDTMTVRPKHFLDDGNIDKYIDAHLNKKQLYKDAKETQRL